MRLWIVEVGEPLPGIDAGERDWRAGMLAKTAVAKGHEVVWWASTFHHGLKRQRFEASRTVDVAPRLTIRCLHGPGYETNTSLHRVAHHLQLARSFAKEARSAAKPDVVFCCLPTLELADQAVKYGQRHGLPVIVDIRDLWPDHYLTLVPKWARALARVLLVTEFRRASSLLRGATGITAISSTFLEWGLRRAERPGRPGDGVFPMGYPRADTALDGEVRTRMDSYVAKYGFRQDELVLVFVGTFVSSFDLQTVIRAARALEHERFRFVLVGDGGDGPALRAQAGTLSNVVFTGWVDHVSIRALLGLASAGLAPYRDDASMSLPNKPFEYLSAGLPIISSLRGELYALLDREQVGLNYQANDVQSLVGVIRSLAERPDATAAMAARARSLFESRYSEEIVYAGLTSHLEAVAGRGR